MDIDYPDVSDMCMGQCHSLANGRRWHHDCTRTTGHQGWHQCERHYQDGDGCFWATGEFILDEDLIAKDRINRRYG